MCDICIIRYLLELSEKSAEHSHGAARKAFNPSYSQYSTSRGIVRKICGKSYFIIAYHIIKSQGSSSKRNGNGKRKRTLKNAVLEQTSLIEEVFAFFVVITKNKFIHKSGFFMCEFFSYTYCFFRRYVVLL